MSNYLLGDTVLCKVEYGKLVYSGCKTFEYTRQFDIVAVIDGGYLILVPQDVYLSASFVLDAQDCKEYKLHKKFIGGEVCFADDTNIVKLTHRLTGLICIDCGTYADFSEVNRIAPNGSGALLCWNCRNYKHYQ